MARLEELVPGARVRGILPAGLVSIEAIKRHGTAAIELIYKDASGAPHSELLCT